MEKVVIRSAGGYEKLEFETFENPKPEPHQALIGIKAIGVNFADVLIRLGVYESAKKLVGWPITPGFEFSGTVLELGKDCTKFKVGDVVFGVNLFGGYSTHLCVPEHQLYLVPKELTLEEAAGFPSVHLTAFHALFQNVKLYPQMKILVHSAGGGVGTAVLQLGKDFGCTMVGVVGSTAKVKVAKEYGAHHVIDKSTQDLWVEAEKIAPEGYDIILDGNGFETLKAGYDHLRPTGKLMSYGFHSMFAKTGGRLNLFKLAYGFFKTPRFSPLKMCTDNKSIMAFNLSFLFARRDLLDEAMPYLIGKIKSRAIKPPPVTTFSLKDVQKAHIAIESGKTTGKLILTT